MKGITIEEVIETKGVKEDTKVNQYKRAVKRLVKHVVTCKSTFITQCMTLIPKTTHKERTKMMIVIKST